MANIDIVNTATPNRELSANDPYLEQIRKLLPVEVSGAFITINSYIDQSTGSAWVVLCVIAILSAICFLYLKFKEKVSGHAQLIFTSAFAFPTWAAAIAHYRCEFLETHTYTMPLLVILVSLASPLIVHVWPPPAAADGAA